MARNVLSESPSRGQEPAFDSRRLHFKLPELGGFVVFGFGLPWCRGFGPPLRVEVGQDGKVRGRVRFKIPTFIPTFNSTQYKDSFINP
ncbi:hypothetical protein AMOR_47270 [Anaeromyxobacter oryzae]|uniref:Uncharacterized protein n=1 Tax=Anaeromyxobacter oryzae TaxID=2918170 RepID=A0ABM7X1R7_9BACT|nr:hypothetical protein AMOR_47270 [Anaeromyxobacter oryzae]